MMQPRKPVLPFSILLLALACSGSLQAEEGQKKVVIGELDWDGARAIQYVLKAVMEDRLGLKVETVTASPTAIITAMDEGKGEIDVFPDLWMPNHSATWKKYIDSGSNQTVRVNKPYAGAQGIYIPGYIQDEQGIHHVRDLIDPEVAKLFDTDSDGKGEYWAGPADWTSTNVLLVKAKTYGLDKYFEAVVSDDKVFKEKLVSDYKLKKGLIFYYYEPDWIHASLDLRRLEEPAFDGYSMPSKKDDPRYTADGCWHMLYPSEDDDWLAKSRVNCAFPDSNVYVAYARSLRKRVPKAARFLSQVVLTPDMISRWNLLTSEYEMDPAEMAKIWVSENKEVVDRWLEGIP